MTRPAAWRANSFGQAVPPREADTPSRSLTPACTCRQIYRCRTSVDDGNPIAASHGASGILHPPSHESRAFLGRPGSRCRARRGGTADALPPELRPPAATDPAEPAAGDRARRRGRRHPSGHVRRRLPELLALPFSGAWLLRARAGDIARLLALPACGDHSGARAEEANRALVD